MSTEQRLRLVGLTLSVIAMIACGTDGDARAALPLGPSPSPDVVPTPAPPTGPPVRLTVANGWTNAPVPRARVTIGGDTVVTDAAGQFEVATPVPCEPVTIAGDGFLERRVNCLAYAASQGSAPVTLWPVDGEEERAALRAFAFADGQLVRRSGSSWDVDLKVSDRDRVLATWQHAAARLRTATANHLSVEIPPRGWTDVVVRPWNDPLECRALAARWFAMAGVCLSMPPTYDLAYEALVLPTLMTTETAALRAFLYVAGFRPHPLPGVLNDSQPGDALSDFERRTLHMLSLRDRGWPGGVAWPDREF